MSYVDEIKVIILNCQTTKQLLHQYAEFFVDQQTTDFVKFVRGKCYSRKGKCNDKRCVCSKNGQDFKWIFYPKDYLRSQYVFSCQVRSLDKNNNVITTTVVLLYDGSGNVYSCNISIIFLYKHYLYTRKPYTKENKEQ